MSFYELQAPTEWAVPPSSWSSTTLDDVETCPRRWQLLRSRWGGQRGNAAFGSAEFAAG
jgi:hypothetical protein